MSKQSVKEPDTRGLVLGNGLEGEAKELVPTLYSELRSLAHQVLRNENRNLTLRTTALVNEAYLKLAGQDKSQWKNKGHFLAVAATAMRHILVDYFRGKKRQKRGGGEKPFSLDESSGIIENNSMDILALDEALNQLAQWDIRKCKIVELRFFAGLTADEIARVLEVSAITVQRDWQAAKAWLHRELTRGDEVGS